MYTVFSVDSNRVDPGYLLRYLKSPRALAEYGRLGKGSAHRRRSIALDVLGGLSLPLPPLDDQRRAAAILDGAEAQRARQRILVDRLQALTERIFIEAFGRPLRSGGADRQALGGLAKIIRGASPRPAGDPRYFGDGSVPWLKIGDISREAGPTVRTVKETVTDAGRHKSVLLPPNTLVLTNSATVGVPKIIEPAACIHDGFLAFLNLDESVEQLWLYWALAVSRDDIVRLAPEGTQKNLNGPIVKAIEMAVPSRNRQRAFVEVAGRIEEQRNRAQRVTDLQDELFFALQSRAFGDES